MKKIFRKIIITLTVLLTLVILAIAVLLNFVFTPDRITPTALRILNENIDASANCDGIELTFFSSFPYLRAKLSGTVITARNSPADTLGYFEECSGTINVRDLLLHHTLNIRKFQVKRPMVNLVFDKNEKSNWEIFRTGNDTSATDRSSSSFTFKKIKLKELRIDGASVNYTDSAMNIFMTIPSIDLRLSAVDDSLATKMKLETIVRNLSLRMDSIQFAKNISTEINTAVSLDKKTKQVSFSHGDIAINNIHFDISGKVGKHPDRQQLLVDLQSSMKVHSLDTLWKMIPQSFLPVTGASIAGTADLQVQTKGVYGEGELPLTEASLKISNGSLAYAGFPGKIDQLETDLSTRLDFASPEKSRLLVNKLLVKGNGISVDLKGTAEHLLADPLVSSEIRSEINLDEVRKFFPLDKNIRIAGKASLALKAGFHFKPGAGFDYQNMDLEGNMLLEALSVHMNNDSILFHTGTTKLSAKNPGRNTINGRLDTDSIHLALNHHQDFYVRDLHVTFDKRDGRGKGFPIGARISVKQVHYLSNDSLEGTLKDARADLRLQPGAEFSSSSIRTSFAINQVILDKKKITGAASNDFLNFHGHQLKLDSFSARLTRQVRKDKRGTLAGHIDLGKLAYGSTDSLRLRIRDASIEARLKQNGPGTAPTIFSALLVESIRIKKARDLFSVKKGNYQLTFSKDSTRDWWPTGTVAFANIHAVLPAIGVPLAIEESKVDIGNHSIELHNASIVAGHSRLNVNGKLSHLYEKKDKQKIPVEASLSVNSSLADANELMSSMHNATSLVASFDAGEDLPVTDTIATTEKTVFEIPKDINFRFDLKIDRLLFGQLVLENINGKARMENGKLVLPDISFKSAEALVQAKLRYEPISSRSARVNYSLRIQDLEMNHIKDLAPSLDTLLPLAKSMEGRANINISGIAMLNEHLEPDMKSVKSVALLEAHHIHVGKSEAFRELAKTFMFKNKENTEIDTLNVEMLITDNKLEILPALVEVDRYQLAVGGIQNLDLSYTYHVSVLKSQIPFKTGVDIKGTAPEYNISLTRAKYKYYFSDKARLQEKADKEVLDKKKFILDRLKF